MGLSAIDTLRSAFDKFSKRSLATFCELETSDFPLDPRHPSYTLVGKDGSLLTLMRLHGSTSLAGNAEIAGMVNYLTERLATILKSGGHALHVVFRYDPEDAPNMVRRAAVGQRAAARQQNLDILDLIDEREGVLPGWLSCEDCLIAIWTRPGILTAPESKAAMQRNAQARKSAPVALHGQDLHRALDLMRSRHTAASQTVRDAFAGTGSLIDMLEAHEALVAIRNFALPETTGSGWRPLLPGDRVRPRAPDDLNDRDASCILWPPLEHQLFTVGARHMEEGFVEVGNRVYAGLDMTLGPDTPRPFSYLINSLIHADDRMPWRFSILLEGGGMDSNAVARIVAGVLGFMSHNRQIKNAYKAAAQFVEDGGTIVKMRCNFATWANVGETEALRLRLGILRNTVEGWGTCGVSERAGDPLDGIMSSTVGLRVASTAPAGLPPLGDALAMLPLGRTASPWREGSVLLRTPGGKLFPFQPGSSMQNTWVDIIVAPPGRGKSVLLNTTGLACVLSPQVQSVASLPRVGIIDIGPSSSGLISLLRDALPEDRKHEAIHVRLRNVDEHTINVFDTQLGCRKPLPADREYLVNLLSLITTPEGRNQAPYDGMVDLISRVVDVAYDEKSDTGKPNPYTPGIDREVDEALERYRITLQEEPSWWEVVDALFDAGLTHHASLAQRHAVPVLGDIVAAAHEPRITAEFASVRVGTGETIIEALSRKISTVSTEMRILAGRTRFDLSDARVVALDLDEVAPKGSDAANRKTAVMYLLARRIIARDYFLYADLLPLFPKKYRDYHERRIGEIRETKRRLVYDEYHRTRAAQQVRDQAIIDVREGRKAGLQMAFASQLIEDFSDELIEQSTAVWVLGAGETEQSIEKIAEKFELGPGETSVVRNELKGPRRDGSPLLAILKTKRGTYRQHLMNTIGPIELWAFSTTAEDAEIRRRLYSKIGPRAARRVLARRYPGGSAIPDIEARKKAAENTSMTEARVAGSVLDTIVNELLTLSGQIESGAA